MVDCKGKISRPLNDVIRKILAVHFVIIKDQTVIVINDFLTNNLVHGTKPSAIRAMQSIYLPMFRNFRIFL